MTTMSPWGPQDGPPQTPPAASAPPHPGAPPGGYFAPPARAPQPRRPWGIVLALGVIMVAAVAATAAITYVIARNTDVPASHASSTPSSAPSASATTSDDQAAAKAQLCQAFDATTRGKNSQGPIVTSGVLNVPVVLRTMNGIAVVKNLLTRQVPGEVADSAKTFVDSELKLVTSATANGSIEELTRLNDQANAASDRLSDACGLPH